MGVAEGSIGPLKGKALLCIALLLRAQPALLLPACNSKLVSLVRPRNGNDSRDDHLTDDGSDDTDNDELL